MAAPLVAGTAALPRAAQPELAPRDVVRKIERTATPLTGDQYSPVRQTPLRWLNLFDGRRRRWQVLPHRWSDSSCARNDGYDRHRPSATRRPPALRATRGTASNYLKNVCVIDLPPIANCAFRGDQLFRFQIFALGLQGPFFQNSLLPYCSL